MEWAREELWRLFRGLPEGLSDEAADAALVGSMPCDLLLLEQAFKWLDVIEKDRTDAFPTAEVIEQKQEEIKDLWVGGLRRRHRLASIELMNIMEYDSLDCGVWQLEGIYQARAAAA